MTNFIDLTQSEDEEENQQRSNEQSYNNVTHGETSNSYNDRFISEKDFDRKSKEIIRISLDFLGFKWDMEDNLLFLPNLFCEKIALSSAANSQKDLFEWMKQFFKSSSKVGKMFAEISAKVRAEVMEFSKKYETKICDLTKILKQIDQSFEENDKIIQKMMENLFLFYRLYANMKTLRKEVYPNSYLPSFYINPLSFFSSTVNSPPPAANNAIDHLLRERTRLYLICLLGTLPPFILFLLPIVQQILGIPVFFTPFYAIFHLQQPILMMALSVKVQHEMLKVFKNTMKLILGTPSATNGSTSFVVIRHAWT
ncbi:hypothetical protein niasHT_014824 [Heterodera trifolii]|uniref:Uncharacterized protein n=1 Tax=Heterodera trifolii TaxID=157864 RepID=A0ABD2L6M5_9BILA